ncbi:hypothetical protein HY792_05240, partial [Candidatus Desantisbacteria bacterium]|nr:hypothetical protein [Candidatus Desantisbacteria bacterium]
GTHQSITTVQSAPSGTFSVTFLVDTQSSGSKQITASTTNEQNIYKNYEGITTIFRIEGAYIYLREPPQGSVSTLITVQGGGFHDSKTVYIHFGTSATITTTTANESGVFSVTFRVDTQPSGVTNITAISYNNDYSQSERAYTDFRITGAYFILIQPLSGTVGTNIIVEGVGFDANGTVTIHFGTHYTITTTIASPAGTFSTSFRVSTQAYGATQITASSLTELNRYTGTSSERTLFQIRSEIITFNPTFGSVSTIITLQGTGFNKEQTVRIDFGTNKTITTAAGNVNGTFSLTFRVNTQCWGTTTITVSTTSGASNTTNFIITGAYIILVSPTSGAVGTRITVEGVGFNSLGTVSIDFGTHFTITTVIASASGTFSTSFLVNTQPFGIRYITAHTNNQRNINKDYAGIITTFSIRPDIILFTPTFGSVSTLVTIIGRGFDNFGSVTISFGTNKTIAAVTPTLNGTFSTFFRIDTQSWGTKYVTVSTLGSTQVTTSFIITGAYIINLTPRYGSVSTWVTLEGIGFDDNITGGTIRIEFGTNQTITTVATNADGTFSVTFRIDTQCWGTKGITVHSANQGTITKDYNGNIVSFIISGAYIILVSPTTGPVSQEITVHGVGFNGSETVRIDFGTHQSITTVQSAPSGTFSVTFNVSIQSAGSKQITASTTNEQNIYKNYEGITTI